MKLFINQLLKEGRPLVCSLMVGFLFLPVIQAQEKDSSDLNKSQNLETVVLTGQYNPQSVDSSVYEVEVIDREDIKRMGGNTLDDVLTQTLNLNISPNPSEGRSGVGQFGFGSDYIKIMVDGIPLVGDEGFGSSIDVSQINLDDIEQIEIIEGAMGVLYGANAVTGVINIITKKRSIYDWKITPYIQEESSGNEYAWFDQGCHIQSIKVGHNLAENWFAEASYTRNDFQGFAGEKQRKNYYNTGNPNDGKRGYEWLPKEQNTIKTLLNYDNLDNFRAFYKFEYFHEQTNKFGENVRLNPDSETQSYYPTASDAIYRSKRFYHHLNLSGELKKRLHFNLSVSYQKQTLNKEDFTYHLKSKNKTNQHRRDYNTHEGLFSRGTLSNFFDSDKWDMQVGYEVNLDKGEGGGLSEQDSSSDHKKNKIETYSGFASAEIKAGNRLALQPGFRYMATSKFSDQYALSLNGKYQFNHGFQLRAIFGTSPKTPTFEQLYFYLVDANHDVRGNKNLTPEKGKSIFLHLKKQFKRPNTRLRYKTKLSAHYLDVNDKIDLIITGYNPLKYQYSNINSFRHWGLSFRNQFYFKSLSAALGASLSGESKQFSADDNDKDDFLYSFQLNANVAYRVPDWDTEFSIFYKYNGPHYQFIQSGEIDATGNPIIQKGKQGGYGWLNSSLRKQFFDKRFEVTLGARNLLNIKTINTSAEMGDLHSDAPSSLMLGYGRSYFLKFLYNLNF